MNESIYKIGRTIDIIKRYKQYPKESILIYCIINENYYEMEKKWINRLNNNIKLKKRDDIGREYFEGDYNLIINDLIKLIDENEEI